MAIPEGYTPLAKIGISYKGDYAAGTHYKQLDAVYYKGSTFLALIDSPAGAPCNDGTNWRFLAQGAQDISDSTVTFTQADARENIESGESAKTFLGKIRKWLADLTAPAFAQMISSYTDLMANTASGYLPDALAVKDGFNLIKWKYHGAVSGGTELTLPSDYTELKVTSIFTVGDSEISVTVNILRNDLSDSVTRFFEVGNLDTRVEVGARTNTLALYVCQKGGADFLSSTYTKCYYR